MINELLFGSSGIPTTTTTTTTTTNKNNRSRSESPAASPTAESDIQKDRIRTVILALNFVVLDSLDFFFVASWQLKDRHIKCSGGHQ
jgi:hypothetical protein